MTFGSILFEDPEQRLALDQLEPPAFFSDLHLDQVVDALTGTRREYRLEQFFYAPLHSVEAISYRHDILRDLEDTSLQAFISTFAQKMRSMRQCLIQADKLRYRYQRGSWFLDAVSSYREAVTGLWHDLTSADIKSRGLLAFREYLANYINSDAFTSLLAELQMVNDGLSTITYSLHIQDNRITVDRYNAERDYTNEIKETFARFQLRAARDYSAAFSDWPEMNHVEGGILDRVARLFPDVFQALDSFCDRHHDYLDETVAAFDREVQFYVAYIEYMNRFAATELGFCYPLVSDQSKEVSVCDTFDLALANKLISRPSSVVRNSFSLQHQERIFVVTGPNQGGKTTFARTFGQLHYLASIGCPVPGSEAHLFLFDSLFTHFERQEHLYNLRGKLEDDLVRIHAILMHCTANSIVIINEIFTSTTLRDALILGKQMLGRIIDLDMLCVYVTFVDELATLSTTTVSMVSTVAPRDPTVRTYKVVRRAADGRAYAAAIAEKYGLTYERLKERIAR